MRAFFEIAAVVAIGWAGGSIWLALWLGAIVRRADEREATETVRGLVAGYAELLDENKRPARDAATGRFTPRHAK